MFKLCNSISSNIENRFRKPYLDVKISQRIESCSGIGFHVSDNRTTGGGDKLETKGEGIASSGGGAGFRENRLLDKEYVATFPTRELYALH